MRIGEQNEGVPENKGGKARNGMGMRVRRISVRMWGIWVEIQKMEESGWRCREVR